MPDICEGGSPDTDYRPKGPEDDIEGPFLHLPAHQVATLAEFVGSQPENEVKLEYRGAGYLEATMLTPGGEEREKRLIMPT